MTLAFLIPKADLAVTTERYVSDKRARTPMRCKEESMMPM